MNDPLPDDNNDEMIDQEAMLEDPVARSFLEKLESDPAFREQNERMIASWDKLSPEEKLEHRTPRIYVTFVETELTEGPSYDICNVVAIVTFGPYFDAEIRGNEIHVCDRRDVGLVGRENAHLATMEGGRWTVHDGLEDSPTYPTVKFHTVKSRAREDDPPE
jgi:hypothetical protein